MTLTHWEEVTLVASVIFYWPASFYEARMLTGVTMSKWMEARKSLTRKGLLEDRARIVPTAAGMEWARGKRLEFEFERECTKRYW